MRRSSARLAASAAVAVALVTGGCESTNKRDVGTALGGLLGGILGHQVDDGGAGGTIIGALVGAAVGRMIGQYMDDADRKRLAETLKEAPRGQTVSWRNNETQHAFAVTPTSDFYTQGDKQCRRFDQVVTIDGRREVMEGVACKSPGSEELDIAGQAI
ncbi:glycine zipper domain-containing protein [Denitromonas iodatirespirans]|uniref:Glycine zipper 2TM domain-containing protein n=1 Tax=Denitromonas iodatirespirans TaxID=2795389 RepID=A0A944DCI3_DENI1|nr:glycine zipper domain-containing protein [Denitromonas iodatirespirans]MBT0961963.1 glycine zipper 2TM domain-containing protein [Denitromonas iodatirespirans]